MMFVFLVLLVNAPLLRKRMGIQKPLKPITIAFKDKVFERFHFRFRAKTVTKYIITMVIIYCPINWIHSRLWLVAWRSKNIAVHFRNVMFTRENTFSRFDWSVKWRHE